MAHREILLRLNAMGDILLTVPTLHALAQKEIEVHLLIHRRWHELAEFLPAQVHLFKGATTMPALIKELQHLQAQAVHDLQGKIATIAIRLFLNAPRQTEYIKRSFSEQLQAIRGSYPLKFTDQRPVWQKYAQTCGVDLIRPDPLLNLSEEYLAATKKILQKFNLGENDYIAVHADASKPGKELPPEFLQVLLKKARQQLVLIGTGTTPVAGSESFLDLRNQISLRELPGLLKFSSGLISSDSGPMHLGRAVDTAVAGIFLQTSPSLGFAPVPGPKVLTISRELPCKPCSLHGQRHICPENNFACRDFDFAQTADEIFTFFRKSA